VNPVLLKARIGASLEKKRLRDQQKELVRRFATSEVAEDLQQSGFPSAAGACEGSVMFSTSAVHLARGIAAARGRDRAAEHLLHADVRRDHGHGGVVNQMVGDGLMAIFGAPLPLADHHAAAVFAAQEMIELVDMFSLQQLEAGKPQIRIGIGIASGRMVAGYTGTQHRATYTCVGDTVNLAARLEAHTKWRSARSSSTSDARGHRRAHRGRFAGAGTVQGQGRAWSRCTRSARTWTGRVPASA
jgi:hypothetical protein